jgi:hypothetical protein
MPEVAGERERAAVDARFGLAAEERLSAERFVPRKAGREAGHRRGDRRIRGIDAGHAKRAHRAQRRHPRRLAVAMPRAVGALACEQRGCESFARDARALGGDGRAVAVGEIAQRLPANRGVSIEQPVDRVHAGDIMAGFVACRSRARSFVA